MRTIVLPFFCFATFAIAPAVADPGQRDSGFGRRGIALPISDQNRNLRPTRILVQPDGAIVVACVDTNVAPVLRLLPSGALDTSFGANGVVNLAVANGSAHAADFAFQPDGKILVVGQITVPDGQGGQAQIGELWRLNTDGSTDGSFGSGGTEPLPLPGGVNADPSSIANVLIQPNGQILLNAFASIGTAVIRLNADGSLDTGWGSGGAVTGFGQEFLAAFGLQNDGKLVLSAYTRNTGPILSRLLPNGAVDGGTESGTITASSGTGGFQTNDDYVSLTEHAGKFAMIRTTLRNVRDPKFASPSIDFNPHPVQQDQSVPCCLAIQANGKIAAVGFWSQQSFQMPEFLGLARVNANGSVDHAFGHHGTELTKLPAVTAYFNATTVQADGKLLGAGMDATSNANRVLVARYLAQ